MIYNGIFESLTNYPNVTSRDAIASKKNIHKDSPRPRVSVSLQPSLPAKTQQIPADAKATPVFNNLSVCLCVCVGKDKLTKLKNGFAQYLLIGSYSNF
jgi:hypothetical protein